MGVTIGDSIELYNPGFYAIPYPLDSRFREDIVAFVPVTNVWQYDIIYLTDGEYMQNSIYVKFDTPPTDIGAQVPAASIKALFNSAVKFNYTTLTTMEKINITDLSSQTGLRLEYTLGFPIAGTLAEDVLPNNVALAIKFGTALRGRSYRGRIFRGGIPRSYVGGNEILPAKIAGLVSEYSTLLSDINAVAGQTQVVVSRISGGAPRASGVATPITGVTANVTLDSQRRRLPGRGT